MFNISSNVSPDGTVEPATSSRRSRKLVRAIGGAVGGLLVVALPAMVIISSTPTAVAWGTVDEELEETPQTAPAETGSESTMPVAEEPAAEEPAAEEPAAEEPMLEEPAAEEPMLEEPMVSPSVFRDPAGPEPVVVQTPAPIASGSDASTYEMALTATIAQPQPDPPSVSSAASDQLSVNVGQSSVVNAPWPVARVSITNPEVADVQVLTPHQVLLIGNNLGTTDMIMWSEDEKIWHTRVSVVIDVEYIRAELAKVFPDCELTVQQSQNLLVVDGLLRRVEQVDQLRATLDSYGMDYVEKTALAGVQQVMINVKVAEASREAIRALGINAVYGGDDFFGAQVLGPDGGSPLNPVSIGVPGGSTIGDLPFSFIEDLGVASGITMFGGFPGSDLEIFIQALAENQYLRMLAEPTLVALSGSEASFLAGGEFPVPVVQGTSAGAGSTITIEYKEFGIRLNFVPLVLGDNRIRLAVAPEVSDLSEIGAVEIEGFRIPAVMTRRAETTLELGSGQTFAMAGLLNQTTTARKSRIPVLGDLPVLGPLFRSTRYTRGETELVVLVTASLVEPTNASDAFPVPGDLHVTPNDWELYIEGAMEGATPKLGPVDAEWLRNKGLDRLKGPGAWTSYRQAH